MLSDKAEHFTEKVEEAVEEEAELGEEGKGLLFRRFFVGLAGEPRDECVAGGEGELVSFGVNGGGTEIRGNAVFHEHIVGGAFPDVVLRVGGGDAAIHLLGTVGEEGLAEAGQAYVGGAVGDAGKVVEVGDHVARLRDDIRVVVADEDPDGGILELLKPGGRGLGDGGERQTGGKEIRVSGEHIPDHAAAGGVAGDVDTGGIDMFGVLRDEIIDDRLQRACPFLIPAVIAALGTGSQQKTAPRVFKPRLILVAGPVAELVPLQLRPRELSGTLAVQPDRQRVFDSVVIAVHRREIHIVVTAVMSVFKLVIEFAGARGKGQCRSRDKQYRQGNYGSHYNTNYSFHSEHLPCWE